MRERIAIIGAGNVATHLALVLAKHFDVACVAARTIESAELLARQVNAPAITDLKSLPCDCDFYLIAVNDDAVEAVIDSTPDFPGIWAHTSGSVGMDLFFGKKSRYGVFYPLQTFSREAPMNLREVPMLIEGSTADVLERLIGYASLISDRVEVADSARREAIHVAAVFACNFANLMWIEADRLLRAGDAGDISLFHPLLRQTLGKLQTMSPEDAMTGPARRGDTNVIHKHLDQLPAELKQIYRELSDRILSIYNPKTF